MKEITKYVSDDGIEFKNKKECKKYEKFIKEKINILKKKMPKQPKNDSCFFANGCGYLQWTPELFNEIKNTLLDYGYMISKEKIFIESKKYSHCRGYIVGRYIEDIAYENSKMKKIKSLWWRMMNIDDEYREWGQGYYAAHPERAEHIKLN